ncbi:lysozyme [Pseudorhodoferax sp.]|uniref:lysozyme n=1 Tax=Pseudorhodoferax sp. TaxID=1993553 RepID=UPI0039E52C96
MSPRQRVVSTIVVAGATLAAGSPFLLSFLGKWESGGARPVLTVYADKLAGGLPTVCNGLTRHVTAAPIIVGQRWTLEQCEAEERAAVVRVQQELARCFRRAPSQQIFDAATSHAWNLGAPATCGSGAMQAWNSGQWALGCQRLARGDDGRLVWSYVRTGRVLPDGRPEMRFVQGLANRRADEAATCAEGMT